MSARFGREHQEFRGLGSRLSQDCWRWLATAGTASVFDRGQCLMRQNEERTGVVVLLGGYVKITRAEVSGNEVMLSVRGPGEVLGDLAAIESAPHPRSATVTALGRCHTRVLTMADFEVGVDRFKMRKVLTGHWSDRYRESERIRAEGMLPALERTTALLRRLAEDVGRREGEFLVIAVGLSQEDLRRAVQLSASTFGACIKTLRDAGLITTSRGRLAIHYADCQLLPMEQP